MPTPAESMADDALRIERKEKKREKKRQRLEAEQAADSAAATIPAAQPDDADNDAEAERQRRKQEKREKKRKRREEQQQQQTAAPALGARAAASSLSSARAAALTGEEAEAYRAEHRINISQGDASIHPVASFAQAGFPPSLLAATASFSAPTPIQAQCWPVLLARRDCIAIADTGSGKTLGFVLPGLVHILSSSPAVLPVHAARKAGSFASGGSGPVMLVLSPTRELALQTKVVCDAAAAEVGLRSVCIYGGVDKAQQRRELERGVHCVVATPGRLLALVDEGLLSLRGVSFLVLDEADRMLDLGFEPDVRAIMQHIRSERRRQTLLFSATWPASVQKLANEFIENPVHISIGDVELKASQRVKQTVEVLQSGRGQAAPPAEAAVLAAVARLVVARPHPHLRAVQEGGGVAASLPRSQRTSDAVAVSGDMPQHQREASLAAFRHGSNGTRLLVATDVVGRGIDITNIDCVINYTFPLTIEDYVHRVGRTGRAGRSGQAITFFTRSEKHLAGELSNVLREAGETPPAELLAFGTGVKKKEHALFGQHFKQLSSDGAAGMKKAVRVKFDD